MAWKKLLLSGDAVTELTGNAYKLLLLDSGGAVIELAHGAINKVLTSGGAALNPTWQDPTSGAHALDAGQSDVTITTPAAHEVLAYNGTTAWINETAAEAGLSESGHLLGSADHGADTLANLNAKVSDATLDDSTATRTPTNDSVGAAQVDDTANNIAFSQLILTPKIDGSGTTEGTMFYDSDDDHLYVYVV